MQLPLQEAVRIVVIGLLDEQYIQVGFRVVVPPVREP